MTFCPRPKRLGKFDARLTMSDDVNELSLERGNGYSWYSAEGVAVLHQYKTWAQAHPLPK